MIKQTISNKIVAGPVDILVHMGGFFSSKSMQCCWCQVARRPKKKNLQNTPYNLYVDLLSTARSDELYLSPVKPI